jgi:hypothetical protein
VYAEFMKNYRREVRLARSLAAAGIAAIRLHYRGSGNSAGDPALVTMPALVADVTEALSDLDPTWPAPAYVGARVGASVAALSAPPAAPLVLWEPVLNGEKWLKEGMRAATISSVSRHIDGRQSDSGDPLARLESEGVLDILGFAHYSKLVDDIRRTKIEELLAERSGPVLIVQIGGGDAPKAAITKLVDSLRARSLPIDFQMGGRDVSWWFEDGGTRDFETDDEIIAATVDWLRKAGTYE